MSNEIFLEFDKSEEEWKRKCSRPGGGRFIDNEIQIRKRSDRCRPASRATRCLKSRRRKGGLNPGQGVRPKGA